MQIRRPLCLLSLIFILLATACVYSGHEAFCQVLF